MTASRTSPPVAVDVDEDGHGPFTASMAAAATIGLSPRWVQYSGVSAAACKVAEALTDLVTMRTRGDQRPTLDREFLAYVAGLSRADKLSPYLRELQDIGFLTVFDGGVDPVTGKRQQRRGQNGRPQLDHFEITLDPPVGYVGPRNMTEVHAQFILDRDAVYRAVEEAGKTPRVGRHAIPRTEVGRLESPQVGAVPGIRGQGAGAVPGIGGQGEFPQVGAVPGIRGQGAGAVPGIGGQGEFPQVGAVPGIRGPLQIDRSSISEREIEGSIEPVPGGTAKPPATGQDERQVVEVRQLVRRLPWGEWAKLRNPDWRLRPTDADEVQAAICQAIASTGITLDQAAAIGQAALSEAQSDQPVTYVTNAFTKHLARRVRALAVEPLADNPLPLLGKPKQQVSAPKFTKQGKGAAAEPDAGEVEAEPSKPVLPACSTCRSEEGETYPSARTVTGADGREQRCPDCLPPAAA